ncbi:succinylglutamate desuccinylase/aspartoacylase family protein [Azospirillum sp. RWY-5-1]|uniref:Succinylglutamate desuccinylase/aspartoacylase family protein n=1 Tax=Azospirillum oleiclasticum TaxID=2735135 RepID=A0ABX2TEW1_9PROT|nr:succinylglutamate desuccinylase/aspartoacylase family protein [Azospirillum oleiclasticum]NYZ14927.1 succinylglutamate desuccinylase/aspartoacylase family protein [Azospirillum oleiclasticum]NYZ22689.1 succinylglutamate desuccinylase/aspartoacylase family protein [Azospirillum oleiclasticum]
MPHTVQEIALPSDRTGTRRALTVHRFGTPGARPKAYVQGGLHADEIPGMIVASRLIGMLETANVTGEIVVVPLCNPIGLAQSVSSSAIGRYALPSGENFNRGFAALADGAAERLQGRIGHDPQANVVAVRAALAAAHAARTPVSELAALRHALLGLALDADIVLDLHCDMEAVVHVYTGDALWPDAADLAAEIGARAVLLASDSGGDPFDEACSAPWWRLAERFSGDGPIPPACLAATVELRGKADVSDALARADAEALIRFLARRGVVQAPVADPPAPLCEATPLAALERITAPVPGIILFHAQPGAQLRTGDPVADIADPTDPASRRSLHAGTDGLLMARSNLRFAGVGDLIASIAGTVPQAESDRGLLFD